MSARSGEMTEDLLTAPDVQKILRVSRATVYLMAQRGQIPCVRWECPGNGTEKPRTTVRFRSEDVQQFIEGHYHEGVWMSLDVTKGL